MNEQDYTTDLRQDHTTILQKTPQQKTQGFNYKSAVAFLCAIALLLLISNIGLVVYILSNKNNALDVNQTYETFVTLQNAFEGDDFDVETITQVVRLYQEQGLISGYEEQENGILIETPDGVNYLYSNTDVQKDDLKNLSVSIINPLDSADSKNNVDSEALEDVFSFFDNDNNGKFIHWDGHIEFTLRFGPVLRTNIRVNDKKMWKKYAKELHNREIIAGRYYFYLCPSYFRNHIKADGLRNSIFILHNDICARDNRLLQILFEKGLGLVVLIDQTIEKEQQKELSDLFMQQLAVQDENGSYRSAQACVTTVLDQFSTVHPDFTGQATAVQLYFPDGADDFSLTEETEQETENSDDVAETMPKTEYAEDVFIPELMPEEAIEIYLDNYDMWKADLQGKSASQYTYGFLDFDFDGVLELVVTVNSSVDYISYNSFYKINLTDSTVIEIANEEQKAFGGGFDLTEFVALFRENATGSMNYYSYDKLVVTKNVISNQYGALNYLNDSITSSWQLSKSYFTDRDDPPGYTNGQNSIVIPTEEYERMEEEFKQENTNLNLQWEPCDGAAFNNTDSAKQKELLLQTYNSFSYDGFSFDNAINPSPDSPEFKIATKGDFDDLCYICYDILEDYDCTSDDAFYFAIDHLLITWNSYAGWTQGGCTRILYTDESDSDPLNYFDPIWPYHEEYDADKVNAVLRIGYNVEPQHNYIDKNSNGYANLYYYDGKYYRVGNDGLTLGLTDGWLYVANAVLDSNGVYTLELKEERNEHDMTPYRAMTVKAEIKEWDGKRIWSIYSVDYTESESFAENQKNTDIDR